MFPCFASDEDQLNILEKKLAAAEKEFADANLEQRMEDLKALKNQQVIYESVKKNDIWVTLLVKIKVDRQIIRHLTNTSCI